MPQILPPAIHSHGAALDVTLADLEAEIQKTDLTPTSQPLGRWWSAREACGGRIARVGELAIE